MNTSWRTHLSFAVCFLSRCVYKLRPLAPPSGSEESNPMLQLKFIRSFHVHTKGPIQKPQTKPHFWSNSEGKSVKIWPLRLFEAKWQTLSTQVHTPVGILCDGRWMCRTTIVLFSEVFCSSQATIAFPSFASFATATYTFSSSSIAVSSPISARPPRAAAARACIDQALTTWKRCAPPLYAFIPRRSQTIRSIWASEPPDQLAFRGQKGRPFVRT